MKNKGITFVEVMIIVAIIALLGAIAFSNKDGPAPRKRSPEAVVWSQKEANKIQEDIRMMRVMLDAYESVVTNNIQQ